MMNEGVDSTDIVFIDDDMQSHLNSLESIALFPDFLNPGELNPKLVLEPRAETGRCYVALTRINPGEVVSYATGTRISRPLKYSRQVSDNIHIVGTGGFDHSCYPNCVVDPVTNNLVVISPIMPGNPATFNYLTTEWMLAMPFDCACREPGCFGRIRGFYHLSPLQRTELSQRLPIAAYLVKHLTHRMPAAGDEKIA